MTELPALDGMGEDEASGPEDEVSGSADGAEGGEEDLGVGDEGPAEKPRHQPPPTNPELKEQTPPSEARGMSVEGMTSSAGLPRGDDGDLRQGANVDQIAILLAALGPRVGMHVRRIEPPDLPVQEMGTSDLIRLDQALPGQAAKYAREWLRKNRGGGSYEIMLVPMDPGRSGDGKTVTLDLHGDWVPSTKAGQRYFDYVYLKGGTPGGGFVEEQKGALELVAKLEEIKSAEKQQEREIASQDKRAAESGAAGLMAQMMPIIERRTSGPDWGAILAGAGAILTPLLAKMAEDRATARAEDVRRQDRRDDEFREMMKELRSGGNKSPAEQLALAQSMGEVQLKFVESQLRARDELTSVLVKKAASAGETEPVTIAEAIAEAIKSRGGDMLAKLPEVAGRIFGPSQEELALRQRLQQMEQERIALATQAAEEARQRGIAPMGQQPEPAQGPRPGEQTRDDAAVNPQGATEARPPVEAHPLPEGVQDPIEAGRTQALQSLAAYLYNLLKFAAEKADVDEVWETKIDAEGFDLTRFHGLSPSVVRGRVEATDPDGEINVLRWVEGIEHPHVQVFAHRLADHVLSNPSAKEWLREVLRAGPWVIEEGDVDEDGE